MPPRRAPRPDRIIVDHSVWARLGTVPTVRKALRRLVDTYRPDAIMICPPVAAELGFSARTGPDHTRLMHQLAAFPDCERPPKNADVLTIQNRLWNRGLLRSVGAIDTIIAAYAMANDAAVLHYDSDFEHVGAVTPEFRHAWIVPRGSI